MKQLEDYLTQFTGYVGQNESYWGQFGSQEEYDGFQRFQEHLAAPIAELEEAQAAAEEAQKNLEAFRQRGRPVYNDPKYIEKYLRYYDAETAANLANEDYIWDLYQYDQKEAELQYAAEAAKTEQERQWYAVEEARQGYFQKQLNNLDPNNLPAWTQGGDTGEELDAVLAEAEAAEKAAREEYDRFINEEPLGTGWWTSRNVPEDQAEYMVQQKYIKTKTKEYMDQHYPQRYAEELAKQDYEKAKKEYDEGVRDRYKAKEDAESYAQGRRNLKHNQDVDTVNMQELYAMPEETKALFLNYLKAKEEFSQGGGDPTAVEPEYLQYQRVLEEQYGGKRLRELEETYHRAQDELETRATALQAEGLAKTGGAAVIPAYLLSFPAKLVGSVSGTIGSIADKLGGTGQYVGFNTNSSGNLLNVYADTLRGTMAGEIKGDGSSGWRNFASYGFQAVNSAGDSLLRAVTTGPYSLALSASATFNDTIIDATKKGASTPEAVALGILNAGIEVATEKISPDNLLDNLGKDPGNWWNILMKAGGEGLKECTTEELSFIGTTLAEAAILRQNSEYNETIRKLRESGCSEQEAIAEANRRLLEEAKETAIVSLLSGAVPSLGSDIIGKMKNPADPNRRAALPGQEETSVQNGWRNAAEYARQGDLNVMDALNRAGLSGSADLARANPQAYAQSFQKALKNGVSYDQALMRATADVAMKVVDGQVPMDTLLYNIGGDTNKAVSILRDTLNRAGINMTSGELNLLGIVAAEASAYRQEPSFQRDVAIEMLKQNSKEAAWTAASETLWREATDRVIAHGIADKISQNIGLERLPDGRRVEDVNRVVEEYIQTRKEQQADAIAEKLRYGNEYAQVKESLGKNAPKSLEEFRDLKYSSGEWGQFQSYRKSIESGKLSAFADFELYKKTGSEIDKTLVGVTTSNGILIASKSDTLISYVIGSVDERRSGIDIKDIYATLTDPNAKVYPPRTKANGSISQKFSLGDVDVFVNPETGNLICALLYGG